MPGLRIHGLAERAALSAPGPARQGPGSTCFPGPVSGCGQAAWAMALS